MDPVSESEVFVHCNMIHLERLDASEKVKNFANEIEVNDVWVLIVRQAQFLHVYKECRLQVWIAVDWLVVEHYILKIQLAKMEGREDGKKIVEQRL